MNISHRQVEIFRAVMQGGSLVAAAMALHTSQPTLSRDLALLEQRLGYRLFDRRAGSRLRPTAAAMQLYTVVTQHYRGLADVQAAARALARQDAGRLRVATLPALAHALLPRALATLTPCPALTITTWRWPNSAGPSAAAASRHCRRWPKWRYCPPVTRCWPRRSSNQPTSAGRTSSAWPTTTPTERPSTPRSSRPM